MEHIRSESAVVRFVSEQLATEDCTIIDVGCSGGLDVGWRSFGSRLRAVGIDPSLTEVARLRAAEQNPKVQYIAAFAGLPEDHPLARLSERVSVDRRSPWGSLSAYASTELRAGRSPPIPWPVIDFREQDAVEAQLLKAVPERVASFGPHHGLAAAADVCAIQGLHDDSKLMTENLWHVAQLASAENVVVIPALARDLGIDDVDFIKIDIDGQDYNVLHSCSELLTDARVLGAGLEVNFFGSETSHHHTFHNTDRFMRAHGFGLFGLTVRTYSSSALPGPYRLAYPAQTRTGRPLLGDALYLRDLGFRAAATPELEWSADKLLKLIALFSLFGLPDQAAEVVLRRRDILAARIRPDHLLDLLALEAQAGRREPRSYERYMEEFKGSHPWFFGQVDE